MDSSTKEWDFQRESHIQYFMSSLGNLSESWVSLDTSRMTVIYFSVVALDMLCGLSHIDDIKRQEIIDYVYMMQIDKSNTVEEENHKGNFGFIGGTFLGHNLCSGCSVPSECGLLATEVSPKCHQGHLAMTYTALATLITLGDDLSRVNKTKILAGMRLLQENSGSFRATYLPSECDTRFLFCACAISAMLNDWSAVDKDKAVQYVLDCITYEGGIALLEGSEAHGGSCYCAVAALALMDRLGSLSKDQRAALVKWCEMRQSTGYQGRTNKDPDSCYSFWVGATLSMLGAFEETDLPSTAAFVLGHCQAKVKEGKCKGGFSKYPGIYPDILHSFYSVCWLSMMANSNTYPRPDPDPLHGLKSLDVRLVMCVDRSPLTATPQSF